MLEVIAKKRFLIPVPWLGANMLGAVGEVSGSLPFVSPFSFILLKEI